MRKIRSIAIVLLLLLSTTSWAADPVDKVLAVDLYGQEMNNWCWDASCCMVLDFYGYTATQSSVATWAVGGNNVGNGLDINGINAVGADGTAYTKYGCKQVLKQFGPVTSMFVNAALTKDEIKTEMSGDRPAILGVFWKKKEGATYKTVGGHAIVLCGKNVDTITLNDPWPADGNPQPGKAGVTYAVDYDAMFNNDATYYGSATLGNQWGQTLKTGRSLDLCFVIDSTSSMSDDISSVKSAASAIITSLSEDYKDMRIAVMDYEDNPDGTNGGEYDHLTYVYSAFTDDLTAANTAVQAITLGYGADYPEAVMTALMTALSGSGIGAWREDAERQIIIMGDAPGHDPEDWSGGYSYSDVISYIGSMAYPVGINTLMIGSSSEATAQFAGFSGASGGGAYTTADASTVVATMTDAIDTFTDAPRFPQGDIASLKPRFSFTLPADTMSATPKAYFLEIQKYDSLKGTWGKYVKAKVLPDTTSWTPIKPLMHGHDADKNDTAMNYRWRLGYTRPSGILTLPSGEVQKIKGGSVMEQSWTEFTRNLVTPGAATYISPASGFTAAGTTVTYQFGAGVNAEAYYIQIYCEGKLWKKFTVKPPKNDPSASVLSKALGGHKVGSYYTWYITSLNYDYPKPTIVSSTPGSNDKRQANTVPQIDRGQN
jgi:hypothetical protein